MARNYLKGVAGDSMNVMLATAAMNFKRVMNLWRTEAIIFLKLIINSFMNVYMNFFAPKIKNDFLRVN
jgi:IS5 family transposase